MRLRLLAAGVAVAAIAGGGYLLTLDDPEPRPRFCNLDGLSGPNGETYGRSGDGDCQFVDADGNVVTEFPDGTPLCYATIPGAEHGLYGDRAVDCDRPGLGLVVRPPG